MLEVILLAALGVLAVLALVRLGIVTQTITTALNGYLNSNQTVTVTDSSGITANPTLPKAQPSTLTTRSTNTTGTLTMTNSSHGVTTGARVDLYWTGGKCYGAVAGTVSGTAVPIASVAGGDNLPAQSTAINVGICQSTDFSLTGNNLTFLGASAGQSGYFVWNDGSTDLNPQYVTAGESYYWYTGSGVANPLSGDTPTKVYMSTAYTTADVQTNVGTALVH